MHSQQKNLENEMAKTFEGLRKLNDKICLFERQIDNDQIVDNIKTFELEGTIASEIQKIQKVLSNFNNECRKIEIPRQNSINNTNPQESFDDDNETEELEVGTSNAMVAVLGYDPKDEATYCRFYDEKTGGCFKGVHCNLVHQKPLEDGWTRDKVPVCCNVVKEFPIPTIGQELSIEMIVCDDIHTFFGHVSNEEFHETNAKTLSEFNYEINQPECVRYYRKFKQISPCPGELVLAPYHEGFYRARVVNVDNDSVRVFYVDYGHFSNVSLKKLYQWEKTFEEIPFQAIRFQIAGIKPNYEVPKITRIKQLTEQLNKKDLIGIFIGFELDAWLVRLYNADRSGIIETLKESDLAKTNDNWYYQKKTNFMPMA